MFAEISAFTMAWWMVVIAFGIFAFKATRLMIEVARNPTARIVFIAFIRTWLGR